jgi:hypothetical protein
MGQAAKITDLYNHFPLKVMKKSGFGLQLL